ncbi:MAG: extracellular solute-binding protein [Pseudomonadota bacterium]
MKYHVVSIILAVFSSSAISDEHWLDFECDDASSYSQAHGSYSCPGNLSSGEMGKRYLLSNLSIQDMLRNMPEKEPGRVEIQSLVSQASQERLQVRLEDFAIVFGASTENPDIQQCFIYVVSTETRPHKLVLRKPILKERCTKRLFWLSYSSAKHFGLTQTAYFRSLRTRAVEFANLGLDSQEWSSFVSRLDDQIYDEVDVGSGELNVYSSRDRYIDEELYSEFEELTGIKINLIEGKADGLIERIAAEGHNSPADVLLTADAGRAWRAEQEGLFQPIFSEALSERIPRNLRHPEGYWFGFSQRARIIFYAKDRVENPPLTYESLADPQYKGQVCTRSSGNIYMLSLMSSVIEAHGEEVAKDWAAGLLANQARPPRGGDADQLRGIMSGECDIAVSNMNYYARSLARDVDGLTADIETLGWVFPNQSDRGTHVNVSAGAVVANAPNRENAVKFLEYLASDQAQEYFSNANQEYPAVPGVALGAPVASLGLFRADDVSVATFGENQAKSQQIWDELGYP